MSVILQNQVLERNTIGLSGSAVYRAKDLNAFLKVAGKNSNVNLECEKQVLEWLNGKFPVPKALYFEPDADNDYLLMSEIAGSNLADWSKNHKIQNYLIADLAVNLKRLHNISIVNCPFQQNLAVKIQKARGNVERGLVDESDFEVENSGKTAETLFLELIRLKPDDEGLVFTHGDFCLPNIIVSNDAISGFVDWERGGIADCYRDIALLFRSLDFNTGGAEQFEEIFCRAYGIEALNNDKIKFYTLLDEFF